MNEYNHALHHLLNLSVNNEIAPSESESEIKTEKFTESVNSRNDDIKLTRTHSQ